MHARMHTQAGWHMHPGIYTHTHTCRNAGICMQAYTCRHTHTGIRTQAYTCRHMHTGKQAGICSAILRMDGAHAAFSCGWMMLGPLHFYSYDSGFSGCTILLVCVFGYQKFTVACLLFSLLCNMSHAKSKNLTILNPNHRHLTIYYTYVRALRNNSTDLEAFLLKKTLTSLLSVEPTCMMTSRTLISNCLVTCQSIARMLGIYTTLVSPQRCEV